MRVEKKHFSDSSNIEFVTDSILGERSDLVFYFGGREMLSNGNIYQSLKKIYPNSIILGCSTGGEIAFNEVYEDSLVSLAIDFENTEIKQASATISYPDESYNAGQKIAEALNAHDLKGIFILSEGLCINGSALVHGISSRICKEIPIMGGLAADGKNFTRTLVGLNAEPVERNIVAIGFYGNHIRFGNGYSGGWDILGPEREITKSKGNVLYEIDGKPFLDVYKTYLGKFADNLPWSALTFPLNIWPKEHKEAAVIRTVLTIDEAEKSMTFAGDIPEGYSAQLMRAFIPRIIAGAKQAGKMAISGISGSGDSVAILTSCIGRRLLLGQMCSEEIKSINDAINNENCYKIGFYSYGEICPHRATGTSELHNQTMTVTTFSEV